MSSSPAEPSTLLLSPWTPLYFSDLSSVRYPSLRRTVLSYATRFQSVKISRSARFLPPRHARLARSAPELDHLDRSLRVEAVLVDSVAKTLHPSRT
nr:unnamed protein product [Callosobruchus chinensis]